MHPNNGMKFTGDTRPAMRDDEARPLVVEEVLVFADGYVPAETLAALLEEPTVPKPTRMQRLRRQAGRLGGKAPWALMAGGLVLGCMAAQAMRRR